jgi:hypothetical protein
MASPVGEITMRVFGIKLYDLMSSVGAAILLIAWLVQQTYLQETSDKLTSLNAARTLATVLQSNRLVLEAIEAIKGVDKEKIKSLLDTSEENQNAVFKDLSTTRVIKHEETEINPSSGLGKTLGKTLGIGGRASLILTETRVEEVRIRESASRAWWTFLAIYLVGGLMALSGSILKALQGET